MTKVNYADARQFDKAANYVIAHYIIELTHETGLEDLLRPDFWKNVHAKLPRFSIVTCIGGKDQLDVDLRVMATGLGYCMMRVIRTAPPAHTIAEVRTSERAVKYIPSRRWCVVGKDGGVIISDLSSREEATERLNEMESEAEAA
jgi:hypothetical protein